MRVFLTVGTHEDPFDRLVQAAVALAEQGHEVRMQHGTSRLATPGVQAASVFSPEAMQAAYAWADVVVSHGGPSTLVEAAAHGHVPILVPRRSGHGEHVDDHQLWFARRVADRVHVVEDPADLPEAVQAHAEACSALQPFGPDAECTRAFADALEGLCEELVSGRGPRRRFRDRLMALLRWVRRQR